MLWINLRMAISIDYFRLFQRAKAAMPNIDILAVLTRALTLGLCLGIVSCASLSIPKQPSDDYIATLLESNKFDAALMAIDKWQQDFPNDIELPKQRKQITQAISRFETDTLKTASQLDAKGQWQDAKNVYETALETLPSSQPLQNAYSEFSVRRLNYINTLKEELDVAQAKHWLSVSTNIEAVYRTAPNDNEARSWKERSDMDREHLARRLVSYGLVHEDNKHFGTAALRYDLAYKLAPSEFTQPYHERAVKTFSERKAKQKKIAREDQQRQRSKLSQLADAFDRYLSQEEFSLARQTLGAMEVIDSKAPEVIQRKTQLDRQRTIALDKAIQDGKQFYTKGEFGGAIRAWTEALQLDPDNKELKENIQRAKTFRENLERLKPGS